jgi:hypothetical protein
MAFSIQSQGQEYPPEYDELVQANAGMGESVYRTPNPNYPPLAPYGSSMGGSPDGIGAYSRLYQMPTPGAFNSGVLGRIAQSSPLIRGLRAVSGLGADATTTPATTATTDPGAVTAALPGAAVAGASAILVAAVAVGLVLTGVSGYYVGKAVAPTSDKENEYAWWGVFAALAGGPIGLGIEAVIGLNHKGR